MKIENWQRVINNRSKIIWKHDTGVTIMLAPSTTQEYKLVLFDKQGREHFRIYDTNKTKLEHEASKWQKDYNKFLRSDKRKMAIPQEY